MGMQHVATRGPRGQGEGEGGHTTPHHTTPHRSASVLHFVLPRSAERRAEFLL